MLSRSYDSERLLLQPLSPPRGASLEMTGVWSRAQALVDHLSLHDFNKAFLQTPPLPAPFLTSLFDATLTRG